MGKYRSYSKEFKDAIVTKLVNRGDSSIAEVCKKKGMIVGGAAFALLGARDAVTNDVDFLSRFLPQ